MAEILDLGGMKEEGGTSYGNKQKGWHHLPASFCVSSTTFFMNLYMTSHS